MAIKKVIAIYPGRFQPFGKHHETAFKWLQKKFGAENTYIATSNKTELPKSPFTFSEKKEIISQYGLENRVVQTKNPYRAEEIISKYNPDTTAVVFMVGEKDMKEDPRFAMNPKKDGSPSYYQEFEKNKTKLQPLSKHGYLVIAPHVSISIPGYGEMSGTNLRKALGANKPRSQKIQQFKAIFGWYDKQVADMIFDKLETKSESMLFSKSWWADVLDLREGYMSAKQQAKHTNKVNRLKQFLDKNTGREFVYDFNEFPKTVFGVPVADLQESLLNEGGAGGHMAHPFDIDRVKTGADLIDVFEKSIDYLKTKSASVKIDGVNASIRFVELDGKKQFVMDRGSSKPLDVRGVTKADLEDRFGPGHGMIKVGGTVLDIFNESIPKITPALKKLGLWDNPNIMFNIEYVAGSTNVLQYEKNFLAIHGLLEIVQVTEKRRATKEIRYNKAAMQNLLDNLAPVANKKGYEVLGSVPTTLSDTPNLNTELNKKYTVIFDDAKSVTKTLKQWLMQAELPSGSVKTVDGKTISPLSKEVLLKLSQDTPLSDFVVNTKDYKKTIDGYIIYLATMKLGDAILSKLDSPLGPVSGHEGIVIRDKSIYNKPFKITGKFILGGLASSFRK